LTGWVAVGLIAFVVRLSATSAASSVVLQSASTVASAGAFVFLALYLATGAVSAVGAYVMRNPWRDRYVKASGRRSRAADQVAMTTAAVGRARGRLCGYREVHDECAGAFENARKGVLEFAVQLKYRAHHRAIEGIRDPALLQALLVPPVVREAGRTMSKRRRPTGTAS
jgi:hypothetical protein